MNESPLTEVVSRNSPFTSKLFVPDERLPKVAALPKV